MLILLYLAGMGRMGWYAPDRFEVATTIVIIAVTLYALAIGFWLVWRRLSRSATFHVTFWAGLLLLCASGLIIRETLAKARMFETLSLDDVELPYIDMAAMQMLLEIFCCAWLIPVALLLLVYATWTDLRR